MKAETFLRQLSVRNLDSDVVVRCNSITYKVDKIMIRKDGTIVIRTRKESGV